MRFVLLVSRFLILGKLQVSETAAPRGNAVAAPPSRHNFGAEGGGGVLELGVRG